VLTRTVSDGDYSFQDWPVTWLNSFHGVFLLRMQYFRHYCSVGQLNKRAPPNMFRLLLFFGDHFVIPFFSVHGFPMLMRWTGVVLWDVEYKLSTCWDIRTKEPITEKNYDTDSQELEKIGLQDAESINAASLYWLLYVNTSISLSQKEFKIKSHLLVNFNCSSIFTTSRFNNFLSRQWISLLTPHVSPWSSVVLEKLTVA
jgi:hypothetical protein